MKILICGLPGSGKTTLAKEMIGLLSTSFKVHWCNADELRKKHNDWDFSHEGRIRQAKRMADFATLHQFADFVIVDFVAPLKEMRDIFDADFTIWVDTIIEGRFEDTNKVFQIPESYDVRVDTQDAHKWAPIILAKIVKSARLAKLDK